MTSKRNVSLFMIIISSCALISSLTDAHPTTEVTTESKSTSDISGNSNNSVQFAITHIVKTIEFQVGVLQDEGTDNGNATDMTTQEYIETDIKLLNVNLLRELLDRATEDEGEPATKMPDEEEKGEDSTPKTKLQNIEK